MAMNPSAYLDRVRQPEYTGANRCLPCTALNTLIAVVLAAGATVLTTPVGGVAVLAVSLAAIYLRGYLVPGTPELTKRYLPDRVLVWFGKAPELPDPGDTVDVEVYLLEAAAVETNENDELVRSEEFEAEWTDGISTVADDPAASGGAVLDLPDPGVQERGEACVVTDGGMRAADWPSRAARLADFGAVLAL
jgi:hypothetical protein